MKAPIPRTLTAIELHELRLNGRLSAANLVAERLGIEPHEAYNIVSDNHKLLRAQGAKGL